MLFGLFKSEQPSFFSLTGGTKIVLGLFGVAAALFGLGYALRPIEEVFDDLHDSSDSDESANLESDDERA